MNTDCGNTVRVEMNTNLNKFDSYEFFEFKRMLLKCSELNPKIMKVY